MGLPLSRYPLWKVWSTVPSSWSSEGWPITASCTFGSKGCPSEATGRRPSLASTSASCSRVACTPPRMSPSDSRARSRLSRTGRSSCTSFSEADSRILFLSRSWRLRELSNSALRRRRESRYWSRSPITASNSASGTEGSSSTTMASAASSVSSTAPVSSIMSGSEGDPCASPTGSSSGSPLSGRFGSRRSSSPANLAALPVLLVVLVLHDLGVLHQVVGVGGGGLLVLHLAVEGLGELVGGGDEGLLLGLYLLDVPAGEGLLRVLDGLLDLELRVRVDLAVHVLEGALDGVDEVVRVVADVRLLLAALVLLGVRLGVAHHLLDLGVREATRGRDRDALLLARPEVLGAHVNDAVRVDIEGDLDLRYTPRRRRDADELEVPDKLVVGRDLALALIDLDLDRVLVVVRGRESLTLARRYSRVSLDQLGKHAALGLDAKREGRDVEEQHVLDLTGEHAGLDGRTYGDDLVRVDAPVGLLARDLLDLLLHRRYARRAADEDDLIDLALLQPRVAHRLAHRAGRPLDEVGGQVVELRAAERKVHVLRAVLVGGDEGEVDRGARRRGELPLGLLGGLDEALGGHLVLGEVYALGLQELRDHPLDDLCVEVVAAEVVVAAGGLDLEDPLAELEDGDIEGAAAEVEDEDRLVLFLVHAVSERRGGRIVDDPLDVEAGDAPRVLGRLALGC